MSVKVTVSSFGYLANGEEVKKYSLVNKNNFELNVISYGASIQSIVLNDKSGKPTNVALGFESIQEYCDLSPYFGSTVGPVANRISNGEFKLNGETYKLEKNNGNHCLHSGQKSFSWKNWLSDVTEGGVKFSLCSLDAEDGFPGEVLVEAIYRLDNDKNDITIEYKAVTDKPTPIDMTNHVYFNLNGHDSRVKVYNHTFKFNADNYLDFVPEEVTVTGKVNACKDSKYDFREEVLLSQRIKPEGAWPEEGYDNFFVLNNGSGKKHVATVKNESTGIELNITTNQNGFQFYTGNFVDIKRSSGEQKYSIHEGFALETHNHPDAVNKEQFPSCILNPDQEYCNETTFSFQVLN